MRELGEGERTRSGAFYELALADGRLKAIGDCKASNADAAAVPRWTWDMHTPLQ
jgi:hypothetical protein